MAADIETTDDYGTGETASVGRWLAEIKAYQATFDRWSKRVDDIFKRYRAEEADVDNFGVAPNKFNILWSNVQTLQPAVYSRTPKVDVTRRHNDNDPVGRAAATILERATETEIDTNGFDEAVKAARDDYLLAARGQTWVRYEPTYGEEKQDQIFLQASVEGEAEAAFIRYTDEDGTEYDAENVELDDESNPFALTETYRPVVSECVKVEHIQWSNFGHTPAPNWQKVRAVWKRELLTRDQLVERFPEVGAQVSLQKTVTQVNEDDVDKYGDDFKRAEVYEIWDKTSRKVYWISPGYMEAPLEVSDDPLNLKDFFPCPKPAYGTMTTDSLVPVPDYTEYRCQAEQIDILTERINSLTKALKLSGAYNGEFSELQNILRGRENQLIPVNNWAMFSETGGTQGAIQFLPIKEIADVVVSLTNIREQNKRDLYEITGISDIVRGQSDPGETLGAQRIKGQYAGMRIQDRQAILSEFARDTIRLCAEVVAEHFDETTLAEASGWQYTEEARTLDEAVAQWDQTAQPIIQQAMQTGQPPEGLPPRPQSSAEVFAEALELLRSDRSRGFRIDIETDSTIFEDQQLERQNRIDFVTAATNFMQQAIPAAQANPALMPLMSEMLMFAVRGFKAGRGLETAFEQAMAQIKSTDQKPDEGQQPNQIEQMRLMIEQGNQQIKQAELQLRQQNDGHEQRMAEMRFAAEEEQRRFDRANDGKKTQIDEFRARSDDAAKRRDDEIEAAKLAASQADKLYQPATNNPGQF